VLIFANVADGKVAAVMAERLLLVETTSSDEVPARIARLLAQRRVRVGSLHMARQPGSGVWSIQLVVDVTDENQAELLVKRLNRVVDVICVVDTASASRRVAAQPAQDERQVKPQPPLRHAD
jgi:acetolactate synthase regulatory subunit